MSLTIRQVTVDYAQGIIDVLNPIIIEGRYTILDQTFTLDEGKVLLSRFPNVVCSVLLLTKRLINYLVFKT